MSKLTNGIIDSVEKERRTQNRITRALKCLEAKNYSLANKVCTLALTEAEYIQDRLCIMYLRQIAWNGSNELTEAILDKAYNPNRYNMEEILWIN